MFLRNDNNSGLNSADIVLILRLIADDKVILGKSPEEINTSLSYLQDIVTLVL